MRGMETSDLAARLELIEAALGSVLRVLPVEAAREVRAVLAEHLQQLPRLTDDEDAVVAGVVARLTGIA